MYLYEIAIALHTGFFKNLDDLDRYSDYFYKCSLWLMVIGAKMGCLPTYLIGYDLNLYIQHFHNKNK